ncbi:hypothetical protein ACVBIL_12510 [Shewanella sp. 125m-7]
MSRQRKHEDSSLISKVLSITTIVLISLFFIDSSEQLISDGFIQRFITNLDSTWR